MTTLYAKDKSVWGVLYHVACSLTRPTEPGATVYVPNADAPSSLGVSVQDFSYTEVVTAFIGNRFMVPGIEMVSTQSETTRIVQTSTNSGILLLMRGSLMLAGLSVSKVDADQIMGVYTDHAEAPVRTDGWHTPIANGLVPISGYPPDQEARNQDLMDLFKMSAYMDKRVLQGNAHGPVFQSLRDAMEHLRVQLGVTEYEMLEKNLALADQLITKGINKTLDTIQSLESLEPSQYPERLYATSSTKEGIRQYFQNVDKQVRQFFENIWALGMGLISSPDTPSPENYSWPAPTKISTQPGPLTVFYEATSGYLECLRYEAEQNMVYRLARSYGSFVSGIEVDMLSVSTLVIMVSFFHAAPANPSAAVVAGGKIIFRRFDLIPAVLDYFVVRSGPTIALLADKGKGGLGFAAGAIVSVGTQTVLYVMKKTAESTLYVTGYLAATVAAALFIYTSNTNKRRKTAN